MHGCKVYSSVSVACLAVTASWWLRSSDTALDVSESHSLTAQGVSLMQQRHLLSRVIVGNVMSMQDPPASGSSTVIVMKNKIFSNPNARCKCCHSKVGGSTSWGNLGKDMSEQQCKDACLSEPTCKFTVYHKRRCSSFRECTGSKVDKYESGEQKPFVVWEKTTEMPSELPAGSENAITEEHNANANVTSEGNGNESMEEHSPDASGISPPPTDNGPETQEENNAYANDSSQLPVGHETESTEEHNAHENGPSEDHGNEIMKEHDADDNGISQPPAHHGSETQEEHDAHFKSASSTSHVLIRPEPGREYEEDEE